MYSEVYQRRQVTVFYSIGSKPLQNWKIVTSHGSIKRQTDADIKSLALDFNAPNISTNYIMCPKNPNETLGIRMPYFVMLIKNKNKAFSFEIQLGDDNEFIRRFRISTFTKQTSVKTNMATLPLNIKPGWNTLIFDLRRLMMSLYGVKFHHVVRLRLNANFSLRRIYFCDRLYMGNELKDEYKLIIKD